MTVDDWKRITESLSPDIPVIFYNPNNRPLAAESYCDGGSVSISKLWDCRKGWLPCVLVELGKEL